ncbi:Peroxiredoxin Q, chloroplastic [Babesia bigemina]|uniref:thioredoxin-dependent peroxiredoxin n=1 Tax=Babesia bigemina TaxID=5866 RepID=A0A061D775_BABBI|nr:Peroxiredoxin Q, chloroplastic [Babesia bigemina]CDR95812.1 Peroxiredoxin Q, chloroplastic [Babesia bigemina]|eukprot:XP_012767998.1 Peroxiredoxin Q, chloroplastic [Babesia bigemina]
MLSCVLRYRMLPRILFLVSLRITSTLRYSRLIERWTGSHLTPQLPESGNKMIGRTLPSDVLDSRLLTDDGGETTLRSILSDLPSDRKGLVMFLFPSIDTPFCTAQACAFSSSTELFQSLGYQVYGLTRVSGRSTADWIKRHELNFAILMDPDWTVIKYFRCTWMYFLINRSHAIIRRDGKVLALERGVPAHQSASRVLEIIKALPSTDR